MNFRWCNLARSRRWHWCSVTVKGAPSITHDTSQADPVSKYAIAAFLLFLQLGKPKSQMVDQVSDSGEQTTSGREDHVYDPSFRGPVGDDLD